MSIWDLLGKTKREQAGPLTEMDREIIEALHFQLTVLYDELVAFRCQLDDAMKSHENMAEILVNLYGERKSGQPAESGGPTNQDKGRAYRSSYNEDHPGAGQG